MDDEYEPQSVDPPPPPWEPAGQRRKDARRHNLRRNTKPLGPASQRLISQRLRREQLERLGTRRRLWVILLASLALLAIAALGLMRVTGQGPFATEEVQLTPPVSLMELATEYPELADILGDPKLDSAYKDFLLAYQSGGSEAATELARQRGLLNANGDLRLTLELDTEESSDLQRELEENGIQVTAVSGKLMDIAVPLGLLERLMAAGTADNLLATITNLNHVVRIRLPQTDINNQIGQATPAAPETPPAGTPSPASPLPGIAGPLGSNGFMLALGVLLCVVAPLLLGLGIYLLISGLGLTRRKNAPPPESLPLPAVDSGLHQTAASTPAPAAEAHAAPTHPQEAQAPPPAAAPTPAAKTVPENTTVAENARFDFRETPAGGTAGPQVPPATLAAVTQKSEPPAAPPPAPPALPEMLACRQCGHANRPTARFCARCGALMQPPELASPPPGPSTAPASLSSQITVKDPPQIPTQPPAAVRATTDDEQPLYCGNCGQRLRPSSRFCPFCGDKI